MQTFDQYLLLAAFLLTCVVLVFTSYTDVKRRTINSFIFIPVLGIGALYQSTTPAPVLFIILGILLFLATYLETDLVIYPIIGVAFLLISLYIIITVSISYGFTAALISLIFLLGFQERLFGIGDIKAMIALFFTFTNFPFLTFLTERQAYLVPALPLSMVMLFNIALVSIFFVPYLVIVGMRKGDSIGIYSVTSMKYDEEMYSRNKERFNLREGPEGKVMVYKTPFMVSVSIGFIITMIAGFWFIYL